MLADAIAAQDWPRALALALEAWRAQRHPALADLVDRIAARCPNETPPRSRIHPWWTKRARSYDPVVATSLLAHASEHALKSDVSYQDLVRAHRSSRVFERIVQRYPYAIDHRNLLERLALVLAWPDDPRVARVLATWFVEGKVDYRFDDDTTRAFYTLLADELVRLGDVRVVPLLERAIVEPQAITVGVRELQAQLARRVIRELHAPPALANTDEIATWCPAPTTPPAVDERALWAQAATDAGARLVLADYLLTRNDRRGEIITLACSEDRANAHESFTLLHQHWDRWMGELALVLDRGGCTFEHGLMRVATIGMWTTPEWAYAKHAGHRELASVHTLRCGWRASDGGYLEFLDAVPALPPRVRLTATMLDAFARRRPRWPIRALELVMNRTELRSPLADAIAHAARVLPDVETIDIPMPGDLDAQVIAAVRAMPAHFPKLARVHVDATRYLTVEMRAAVDALAALPYISIDHGRWAP